MRDLALRPGPHSEAEQAALLDYCETDVVALAKLLPAMAPKIDLPRALLRGRYMAAVASMEWNGVPIDVATLRALQGHWDALKGELVEQIDPDYGVYVPTGCAIDPESKLETELTETTEATGVDLFSLASVANDLWREDRTAGAAMRKAIAAVRKSTGLTRDRISAWEESGRDYSTWPGWDTIAREVASTYPELGLGRGYVQEQGFDDTDYSANLWYLLRDGNLSGRKKHDRGILNHAAKLLDGSSYRVNRLSFSARRFAGWLSRNSIPWPRLLSGNLALDDDTFRQMARTHQAVAPLRELRHSLGEMRLFEELAVGADGRNRCLLSPFRSVTGRNQPSNAKFIFGPSCWLRSLIQPEPGRAVAYVDWSQQEFGIAAALSGDVAMMACIHFRRSLSDIRQTSKSGPTGCHQSKATRGSAINSRSVRLGVQYGMAAGITGKIGWTNPRPWRASCYGCTGKPTPCFGVGPMPR